VSVNPGSDVSEPSSVSSSHALGASKKKKYLLLACPQRDSHALGALHFFFPTDFSFFFPSILLMFRAKKDAIVADFLYGFFSFFLQALL
jgi:hypothetical protein